MQNKLLLMGLMVMSFLLNSCATRSIELSSQLPDLDANKYAKYTMADSQVVYVSNEIKPNLTQDQIQGYLSSSSNVLVEKSKPSERFVSYNIEMPQYEKSSERIVLINVQNADSLVMSSHSNSTNSVLVQGNNYLVINKFNIKNSDSKYAH